MKPDGFATVAETKIRLPAGSYRISIVSDDGVRVSVGGKRVIDNWTHHGPTEDQATVDLEAGLHTIRIEHFELTGWSWLSFNLEPARD